jgi:hypothetical protein
MHSAMLPTRPWRMVEEADSASVQNKNQVHGKLNTVYLSTPAVAFKETLI